MMNLVVDSREQNRIEPAQDYFTSKGYDVEVKQLAIGDYLHLKTWSDVYHLTLEDLKNVPGIGDRLAEKIITQINMMG